MRLSTRLRWHINGTQSGQCVEDSRALRFNTSPLGVATSNGASGIALLVLSSGIAVHLFAGLYPPC